MTDYILVNSAVTPIPPMKVICPTNSQTNSPINSPMYCHSLLKDTEAAGEEEEEETMGAAEGVADMEDTAAGTAETEMAAAVTTAEEEEEEITRAAVGAVETTEIWATTGTIRITRITMATTAIIIITTAVMATTAMATTAPMGRILPLWEPAYLASLPLAMLLVRMHLEGKCRTHLECSVRIDAFSC